MTRRTALALNSGSIFFGILLILLDSNSSGIKPRALQLLEVERGWRDMKQILDLRPVYHRLEERIRAHVLLCWLALLLIRIAETTTGTTWQTMRRELQRIHIGTFTGPAGTFRQLTEPTKPQRDLLAKLHITTPSKIIELSAEPR